MSSMNVLELSHADSKHNSLHKREFMGNRSNKVKYHSRVKAGFKPGRTNPRPPLEESAIVLVGIWPGNTPWKLVFNLRLLLSHAPTCLFQSRIQGWHTAATAPVLSSGKRASCETPQVPLAVQNETLQKVPVSLPIPAKQPLCFCGTQERCCGCVRGHRPCPQQLNPHLMACVELCFL